MAEQPEPVLDLPGDLKIAGAGELRKSRVAGASAGTTRAMRIGRRKTRIGTGVRGFHPCNIPLAAEM